MRRSSFFVSLLAFPSYAFADGPGIPLYLFGDLRFFLFLSLYCLLTLSLVLWAVAKADARDKKMPYLLEHVSLGASFVMLLGLLYQIVHHFEHIAQIFQYWYLGLTASSSKGVLFFLDLEWNHFIFDTGYFLMMTIAAIVFMVNWRQAGHRLHAFGISLFAAAILTQGWHAVEHIIRVTRHIEEGCNPCRGIVDATFGVHLIPLHFWYNVFALTLPLMAFFYYRMDRKMLQEIRRCIAAMRRKTISASRA